MTLTQLFPPYPIFTDLDGSPLDAGYLYFGEPNLNPETNPIQAYYDTGFTQPLAQPVRTSNGYIMRNGSPALIYADGQFSVTVRNKKNELVIYSPVGYGFTPGASSAFTDQITYNEGSVGASNRVLTARLQDYVSVKDFGATGDGTTDDTAAIQAAITASAGANKLVFPRGTYRFTSPLAISNIDVDFQKSMLLYDGPVGDFALTLASNAGAGINQINGNRFSDFTLRQEDWTEYVTFSGSTTYDPPLLPSYANITNITPNAPSTTVSVPGARVGGYARATFSSLVDGCVVTAAVTSDNIVTVWFSNYISSPIDMPSGTLSVTVFNNAYHGLCLGGSLGVLENAKIIGFTGVSLALGGGREQITGVDFPGGSQCYYWKIHANVAPAAGWGIVVKPRNNENTFNLSLFPINAYNDPTPRRACCINQVVMSGVTNGFDALSLESASSEEALLVTHAANTITSSKVLYYESNTSFASPPAPYIRAQTYSSGCDLQFRMLGAYQAILDEGVANDIRSVMAFYINGREQAKPESGQNLIYNGDFLNGTRGWSNFSSGTSSVTIPGDGYLSGKRARVDIISGRINLQQSADQFGPFKVAGLNGKTVTAGGWLKTNLQGMQVRANGLANTGIPTDEQWYFSSVTLKANGSDLDIAIIDNLNLTQTGYVEISNISCVIGRRALPLNTPTMPQGSGTYNPPSLLSGASATTTVAVPGAELGDLVVGVSFSLDLQGVKAWGYVSAADTVTVIFENSTGGTIDLNSGTLRALIQKA